MNTPVSYTLDFTSERFDYRGEIPENSNAGNRFYGRDLAGFLAAKLKPVIPNVDFLDEDWGWLLLGTAGGGEMVEICVYNWPSMPYPEPGSPRWTLWIRSYSKRRWLGLIPRKVEVAPSAALLDAVREAFKSDDIAIDRFEPGMPEA